jgi:hypothetical protein
VAASVAWLAPGERELTLGTFARFDRTTQQGGSSQGSGSFFGFERFKRREMAWSYSLGFVFGTEIDFTQ